MFIFNKIMFWCTKSREPLLWFSSPVFITGSIAVYQTFNDDIVLFNHVQNCQLLINIIRNSHLIKIISNPYCSYYQKLSKCEKENRLFTDSKNNKIVKEYKMIHVKLSKISIIYETGSKIFSIVKILTSIYIQRCELRKCELGMVSRPSLIKNVIYRCFSGSSSSEIKPTQ